MTNQEEEYISRAQIIKSETQPLANTAPRVGGLLEESLAYIFELFATISLQQPGQQVVSVYSDEIKYAYDVSKPFAVLWPNSSGQIRQWVLRPTVAPELKFRTTPSYNAGSEWEDIAVAIANLSNYYTKAEINNLLTNLNTGGSPGLRKYSLSYVAGTTGYPLPAEVENVQWVDSIGTGDNGFDLQLPVGTDNVPIVTVAGSTLTVNKPTSLPAGTTSLRIWYVLTDEANPNGFDFEAWLKARPNYNPVIAQVLGHDNTGTIIWVEGTISNPGNITPSPPIFTGDDTGDTLTASHATLSASEILISENNGAYVAYTGPITVGNVSRPSGYWKIKIKAATGRNESSVVSSPAFTVAVDPAPAAPLLALNDATNEVEITMLSNFINLADYEYEIVVT